MASPFLAEIRAFGFSFAPYGWATCDGQLMPISQNAALFSLIGTNFGGNGTSTFGLPNFQGQAAIDQGTGPGLSPYSVGEQSGETTVTVTLGQLPLHNHVINTLVGQNKTQELVTPNSTAFLGSAGPDDLYNDQTPSPQTSFSPSAIGMASSNAPHDNMQPYVVLLFCIALQGIFPTRS